MLNPQRVTQSLTIIGASVRAAAASAVRAGYRVRAGDMFADLDLRALCPAVRAMDYPHGFEALLRAAPSDGWMYTGALENHPRLVARLARIAPLWGNPAEVLHDVRDPLKVAEVVRAAGLPCPDVASGPMEVPRDGTWLRKPLRSAGGARIVRYNATSASGGGSPGGDYFQQFIHGSAAAALFVAARRTVELLGVTRQLVGPDWNSAGDFRYSGSIGPLDTSLHVTEAFTRLGKQLAARFGLRGLFGVDAMINPDDVWPVEINPRYTASAELYDWSLGISTVDIHVRACQTDKLAIRAARTARFVCGKAIVFADRATTIDGGLATIAAKRTADGWPALADVPAAGATFRAGDPIVTVLAAENSETLVLDALRRGMDAVRAALAT